jgi:pimeloyl-CoA synthetase
MVVGMQFGKSSLGVAVFDAETGERLHEFALPRDFRANGVAWEDDEHLLMTTTQIHTQAILRTTLDGAIQRATETAPYDPEGERFGLAPNLFP